jgi:hypothetical protein
VQACGPYHVNSHHAGVWQEEPEGEGPREAGESDQEESAHREIEGEPCQEEGQGQGQEGEHAKVVVVGETFPVYTARSS